MTPTSHPAGPTYERTVPAFADPFAVMAQLQHYANDLKHLMLEKDSALAQIEKAHLHSLSLLARAAEYRDDETGIRMDRVGGPVFIAGTVTGSIGQRGP